MHMPRPRRRSVDSSSSSSSSSSGKSSKAHKSKRKEDRTNVGFPSVTAFSTSAPRFPTAMTEQPQFPAPIDHRDSDHPPPYSAQQPPLSGYRIPLDTGSPSFPPPEQSGLPVSYDLDGKSPIFVGSALFSNSVHPCKIVPALRPPCRVPYGGGEHEHWGRYDLLPFTPETMEWVPASNGRIPNGRRPVEGGYEENGTKLYHALAQVDGVEVPGKTGEHLGGCNVAFGGCEDVFNDNYKILCWRF